MIEPTINELFGPDTKPSRRMLDLFHEILEYNDGKRVTHKVGRFVNDRYAHRNRWVRAMRQTDVPMRLIDGPADPNSGRHMAQRYLEVIPNPDVVMLDDNIGHWPQIEAPDAVLENFLAHVDRVTANGVGRRCAGPCCPAHHHDRSGGGRVRPRSYTGERAAIDDQVLVPDGAPGEVALQDLPRACRVAGLRRQRRTRKCAGSCRGGASCATGDRPERAAGTTRHPRSRPAGRSAGHERRHRGHR